MYIYIYICIHICACVVLGVYIYVFETQHERTKQNITHTRQHSLSRTHLATLYLHWILGIILTCV